MENIVNLTTGDSPACLVTSYLATSWYCRTDFPSAVCDFLALG